MSTIQGIIDKRGQDIKTSLRGLGVPDDNLNTVATLVDLAAKRIKFDTTEDISGGGVRIVMGGSLGCDKGKSAKDELRKKLREHGVTKPNVVEKIVQLAIKSAEKVQAPELVI